MVIWPALPAAAAVAGSCSRPAVAGNSVRRQALV